jgi:hypothetical protein
VVVPAVTADGQFITDGTMTNGGTTLTSVAALFASTDCLTGPNCTGTVNKTIQCGGTAAAGGLSTGTITNFNASNSITVSFTAGSTTSVGSCQWGTDWTTVINSALTSLTKGGTVLLPTGNILVSSLNMSNSTSLALVGAACGVNRADFGTVLIGIDGSAGHAIIDLVGAEKPTVDCLQIHNTRSPVAPGYGLLVASSNTHSSTLVSISRIFVTGTFKNSAIYIYGGSDSIIGYNQFWNYNQTLYGQTPGQLAIYITRDNTRSAASAYATIVTGDQSCGNFTFDTIEAHDFKPGGGSTSGAALWNRGCGAINIIGGLYDSSTSTAGVLTWEQSTSGSNPFRHTMVAPTFYNENGTNAANCLFVNSGSVSTVTILNPSYTCTTTRTGTVSYTGFSTP